MIKLIFIVISAVTDASAYVNLMSTYLHVLWHIFTCMLLSHIYMHAIITYSHACYYHIFTCMLWSYIHMHAMITYLHACYDHIFTCLLELPIRFILHRWEVCVCRCVANRSCIYIKCPAVAHNTCQFIFFFIYIRNSFLSETEL